MRNDDIVLTYFEPFQGREINASKEVVSSFSAQYKTVELPVRWNKVEAYIDEILSLSPSVLILCGEAGSYPEMTLEIVAHNIASGTDNDGVTKSDERIGDGPKQLVTSIDLSQIGLRVSEDAGKFLCNYSYYLALNKARNTKVLFVHFPFLKEEGGRFDRIELANQLERLLTQIKGL